MTHNIVETELDDEERCHICGKRFIDDLVSDPLNYRDHPDTGQRWYWHQTCGPIDMIIELD